MANPRTVIAKLDRQIDAIHANLLSQVKIDRQSSASWQAAWDKFPALRVREHQLFRRRGIAQIARNRLDAQMAPKAPRRLALRKRRCPTCGVTSAAA